LGFRFPVVIRKAFRPGEQIIQISRILKLSMLRDLFQKVLEIFVWPETVYLGCLGNAVNYCTGLGSSDGVNSIPVFLSQTECTDASLGKLS